MNIAKPTKHDISGEPRRIIFSFLMSLFSRFFLLFWGKYLLNTRWCATPPLSPKMTMNLHVLCAKLFFFTIYFCINQRWLEFHYFCEKLKSFKMFFLHRGCMKLHDLCEKLLSYATLFPHLCCMKLYGLHAMTLLSNTNQSPNRLCKGLSDIRETKLVSEYSPYGTYSLWPFRFPCMDQILFYFFGHLYCMAHSSWNGDSSFGGITELFDLVYFTRDYMLWIIIDSNRASARACLLSVGVRGRMWACVFGCAWGAFENVCLVWVYVSGCELGDIVNVCLAWACVFVCAWSAFQYVCLVWASGQSLAIPTAGICVVSEGMNACECVDMYARQLIFCTGFDEILDNVYCYGSALYKT